MPRLNEASVFYNTPAWRKTRVAYLKSVGGLCERCFSIGIVTPAEIIHHKIPLDENNIHDPKMTLGWDNLQALCRECHAKVHDDIYAERTKKRYKIDKSGKVMIRDDTIL